MILKKLRAILKPGSPSFEKLWLLEQPIDRALGPGRILPCPQVMGPNTAQLNGEDLSEFPGYIAIEVTNVCNLQCKHCNYRYGLEHYTRDRGFMNLETLKKVLNEVKDHGAAALMNYDGEPLMHKEFIEYLEIATVMGINNYFNTNGTRFDRRFSDRLVEFYRGSIFFSIDGDRAWFEKIRVPANYDQVVENLKYFIKVNEAHGWPITIGVSLCNLGQTAAERKTFLEEWLPKVNYVSMGEVNDRFGTMISEPMTVLKIKRRPICAVPWQTLGVCHNGDVIPCSIYVTRANIANAIFGNIHRQSLKEIWHGEAFSRFRQMVAQERYNESYCDKCQRWLSQFSFPEIVEGDIRIRKNGYWTTYQNLKKGGLNFQC